MTNMSGSDIKKVMTALLQALRWLDQHPTDWRRDSDGMTWIDFASREDAKHFSKLLAKRVFGIIKVSRRVTHPVARKKPRASKGHSEPRIQRGPSGHAQGYAAVGFPTVELPQALFLVTWGRFL